MYKGMEREEHGNSSKSCDSSIIYTRITWGKGKCLLKIQLSGSIPDDRIRIPKSKALITYFSKISQEDDRPAKCCSKELGLHT